MHKWIVDWHRPRVLNADNDYLNPEHDFLWTLINMCWPATQTHPSYPRATCVRHKIQKTITMLGAWTWLWRVAKLKQVPARDTHYVCNMLLSYNTLSCDVLGMYWHVMWLDTPTHVEVDRTEWVASISIWTNWRMSNAAATACRCFTNSWNTSAILATRKRARTSRPLRSSRTSGGTWYQNV